MGKTDHLRATDAPLKPFFGKERQGRRQQDQDQYGVGVDAGQHPDWPIKVTQAAPSLIPGLWRIYIPHICPIMISVTIELKMVETLQSMSHLPHLSDWDMTRCQICASLVIPQLSYLQYN